MAGQTHRGTDAYKALVQLELFPGALEAPSISVHMGGAGKAYPAYEAPRYSVQESFCIPIEESENAYPVRLVAGDGKTMTPTHDEDGFLLEID